MCEYENSLTFHSVCRSYLRSLSFTFKINAHLTFQICHWSKSERGEKPWNGLEAKQRKTKRWAFYCDSRWWSLNFLACPHSFLSQFFSPVFSFIFLYEVFSQILWDKYLIDSNQQNYFSQINLINCHFKNKSLLWIHTWATPPRQRKGRSSVMSRELCSFSFTNLLILEKEKQMGQVRKICNIRIFPKKLNFL